MRHLLSAADLDRSEYRRLEFPAGGAIGTARDIAQAYSAFRRAPGPLGLTEKTLTQLTRHPSPPARGWFDQVLKVDTAFSLGFARPHGDFRFGSSQRAFGHPGACGSFAFADPDREVSFAYVMNRLGFHLRDDPREKALRDALYRSLVARMGVESQSVQRSADIQDQTVQQLDANRQSISGVNTDEEMVSMVQFQHVYSASARFASMIL